MSSKKQSAARLRSITLKLPWVDLAWKSDESELEALRDLVDQLSSRRAFQVNRGMLMEEPVYFIASVVQLRSEIRTLLSRLPVGANESRILMLTVMDWLAEILDVWSASMKHVNPGAWDFRRLGTHEMEEVMRRSWQTVDDVRGRLDKLRKDLETQLNLKVS